MNCNAYCLAKTFLFDDLKEYLFNNEKAVIFRDILHLTKNNRDIFIFHYGTMVVWDLSYDETLRLIDLLKPYMNEPHEIYYNDEFTYSLDNEEVKIHNDHIYLKKMEPFELMALSHGIAQSVKLAELEDHVSHTIESTAHLPQNMAGTGKTKLRRKEIAKLRGRLHLVEMEINLKFELLDTPEFFWEYPEVEHLFEMTARYLETKPRIELLNKKLTVIHDLLIMLADEQNHKHLAILEWIIIWLIAIEIIYFILNEVLRNAQ